MTGEKKRISIDREVARAVGETQVPPLLPPSRHCGDRVMALLSLIVALLMPRTVLGAVGFWSPQNFLTLAPSAPLEAQGFASKLRLPPNATFGSTWGGSVLKGDAGDAHAYYLFFAICENGCGVAGRCQRGVVAHGVAKTLAGPFEFLEVVPGLDRPFHHVRYCWCCCCCWCCWCCWCCCWCCCCCC